MLDIETRLKKGEVVVIDGAIATELLERDVPVNDNETGFNSTPNVDSPELG